ncbi:MAG TPA: hypothetical protein VIT20_08695 [Propionibacteriaceae bacterium]
MVKTVSVPGSRPLGRVPRPIRWSLWLSAGIVFGLVMGFAVGLAKPHVRR